MNLSLRNLVACFLGAMVLCVSGPRAVQAGDQRAFAGGNARYAAGDFAGAARDYEAQVKSGELSSNLFYNLGDAYYRAGDRGRAILNYHRALCLEPSHAEAIGNFVFVGGGKAASEHWSGVVWKPWNVVAVMAAACGWLGVVGWLIVLAGRRFIPTGLGLACGATLLCAIGLAVVCLLGSGGDGTRAIVVAEASSALYSPVEGAKVVATLPLGGEVRLLSEQGAWSYVLLPDGNTRAWLASAKLEPLVPR